MSSTPVPLTIPMTVLKSLTALRLDVNIWSGCKKLTPADLASTSLPPDRQIVTVVEGLNRLATDFATARTEFLASYDESITAWIADNPGWEDLITRSLVREDVVRSRLHFGWQVFKITPPRRADVGQSLIRTVQGLGGVLLEDIRRFAAETWTKSYAGKIAVSQKALSPLRMLRQKMDGLHVLDPRITPIISLMDEAMAQMPERGAIQGRDLLALQGMLCLLQDTESLLEHGQALLDGQTPQTVLEHLLSQPMAEPATDGIPPAFMITPPAPCCDSLGLW